MAVLDDTPECGFTRHPVPLPLGTREATASAMGRNWRLEQESDRSDFATRPSAGYGSFLVIVRAASVSSGRYRCHSVGGFTCESPLSGLYSRVELCQNGTDAPASLGWSMRAITHGSGNMPKIFGQDVGPARAIARTTAATRPSAGTGGESVREEVRRHGGTEDPHPAQVV